MLLFGDPDNNSPFLDVDRFLCIRITVKIECGLYLVLWQCVQVPAADILETSPFISELHCPFADDLLHKSILGASVFSIDVWQLSTIPDNIQGTLCCKGRKTRITGRSRAVTMENGFGVHEVNIGKTQKWYICLEGTPFIIHWLQPIGEYLL